MSAFDEHVSRADEQLTPELGKLPPAPSLAVAIVTCMDARLVPSTLFGLRPGDVHVIRNAGGIVGDEEIRSLAISQHLLGTREVIVVGHTKCGMMTFTDEELAARLEREAGRRPPWPGRAFEDVDDSVRSSMRAVVESPFLPHRDSVRGFVAELDEGRLREVFL